MTGKNKFKVGEIYRIALLRGDYEFDSVYNGNPISEKVHDFVHWNFVREIFNKDKYNNPVCLTSLLEDNFIYDGIKIIAPLLTVPTTRAYSRNNPEEEKMYRELSGILYAEDIFDPSTEEEHRWLDKSLAEMFA